MKSSPSPVRRVLNLVAFTIAVFTVGFAGLGVLLARAQAYALVHPGRSSPPFDPGDFGLPYEDVQMTTSDGVLLDGWYIPPREADAAAMVFVHGLGNNRGELLDVAVLLHSELGIGALLFDLRNHGESGESLTTFGLNEVSDVRAAVDFLQARPEVDSERIGLMGMSMGGATVLLAGAAIREARWVIAQSAYTSLSENIEEGVRGLTGLPPFPFAPLIIAFGQAEAGLDITQVRPIDAVARIAPRPLLLIHGEADTLVMPRNGEALYAAAGEPKTLLMVPGVGHGGFMQGASADYRTRVVEFVREALASPTRTDG